MMLGRRKQVWPEDQLFIDRGCQVSPRCLDCLLPVCKHDLPPGEAWKMVRAFRGQAGSAVNTLVMVAGERE